MKQLLSILLLSICLYAEATFDQVQSMIDKQQYKQAVLALTIISNNHPASSKVQYTLAQANAGLGNLPAAKEALDRAIALNPKLDFVSASQVNELSSIINAPRVIKPVEPESHWFIWLLSITGVSFVVAYFLNKNNKSSKLSTPDIKPSTKYSPSTSKYQESFYEPTSTAKPAPVNSINDRSYSEPPKEAPSKPIYNRTSSYEPDRTSRPAEVHHHNSASKSDVFTTLATAGLTAAAVSYMMDDNDKPEQPTHSYQPEPISSSWKDDSSSTSSTWDSPSESTSSSWNDDSSSSSDSWSSSSDSSSNDSSWND